MKQTKSKQPRKQRKSHFKADYHLRNRKMTALLSHALREKYGIKRLPVHKDDKVTVFKNVSKDEEIKGKVIRVLPGRYSVHIEGHSKEKADGTIVSFPVHPSNIVITSLNLRDKRRRAMIQRRTKKDITEEELAEGIFDEEDELLDEIEEFDDLESEELLDEEFEEIEMDDLEDEPEEISEKEPKEESS
jgi:ribosomal protein uL24